MRPIIKDYESKRNNNNDNPERGFLTCYAILGLLLAAVISGTILFFTPANPQDMISVTSTEISPNSSGASMIYFDSTAPSTINLLKDVSFDLTENWSLEGLNEGYMLLSSEPYNGREVTLNKGTLFLHHRGINVAHRYYSNITIIVSAEVVSGACNFTVKGSIWRAPYAVMLSDRSSVVYPSSGDSIQIVLEVALHESLKQGLDISGLLKTSIIVESSIPTTIRFKSVEIQGTPLTPLYPVLITSKGTDEKPFFSNPQQQSVSYFPSIRLQINSTHTGFLAPRSNNELVYLPVETYYCQLGWHDMESFSPDYNFTLSIHDDTGISLDVIFQTVSIDILLTPKVLSLVSIRVNRVSTYDSPLNYLLSCYFRPIDNGTLHLPIIDPKMYVSIIPIGFTTQLQSTTIDVDINSHSFVFVKNAIVMVGPLALHHGQLFLMVFIFSLVLVVCVGIQKAAAPRRVGAFFKDRRGLPLILMGVSAFLPWGQWSLINTQSPFGSYNLEIFDFPLVFIKLIYISGSHMYLNLDSSTLIVSLFLFWGPMLIAIDNTSLGHYDATPFKVALTGPVILVILNIIFIGPYAVCIGEFFIIFALFFWLIQTKLLPWVSSN